MAERKKGGFEEDSNFIEILSVGVNRVQDFDEDCEIDDDSDEVEDRV